MFDHLSDLEPPDLGDGFHQRVVSRARRRQRRTRLATGGVALTPLLAIGGIALYLRDQAGELDRIEVEGLTPAETPPPPADRSPSRSVPTVAASEPAAPPVLSTPLTILIAGVDRRPPGDEVTGARADTVAVVRIDPGQRRVGVLSLPRDLWVTTGDRDGRINSFTADGELVEVVSSLLDIDINHYVEVDFDGFESLIDLSGGVTVPFDAALRDLHTGFVAEPGCNHLTGTDALAYVRSRRLERLDPQTGVWATDPSGDLGRIARQQDLMQRVYADVLGSSYDTIDEVRLLTDVIDDVTVDTGLNLEGLRAIFSATAEIGADRVEMYDLAGSVQVANIGAAFVLVADPPAIAASADRLVALTPQPSTDPVAPPDDAIIEPGDSSC